MKDHIYRLVELTGSSPTSIEDAIFRAVDRAYATIRTLCWFQVVEARHVELPDREPWRATIKVGFTVDT